jgi:hypothetical protein
VVAAGVPQLYERLAEAQLKLWIPISTPAQIAPSGGSLRGPGTYAVAGMDESADAYRRREELARRNAREAGERAEQAAERARAAERAARDAGRRAQARSDGGAPRPSLRHERAREAHEMAARTHEDAAALYERHGIPARVAEERAAARQEWERARLEARRAEQARNFEDPKGEPVQSTRSR